MRRSFRQERALYRLFITQYAARDKAQREGFAKRRLAYWVFTDEENERIPNFYPPLNDFVYRLEPARVIRQLTASSGECEVLPPAPQAGSRGSTWIRATIPAADRPR